MTATDSHSAVHSAEIGGTTPGGDANASVRARAREGTEPTAQSTPQSAVTRRDWIEEIWPAFVDWITPPEIWAGGLKDDWEYARRGEWTTRDGVFRKAGQVYQIFVAVPSSAALLYARWIIRRPTRLAAALLLLWFLAQFPPVSWLI